MSERSRSIVIGCLLAVMTVALVALVVTAPSDVDRVETIGEQIKCPVCQGESIANSPSQMARDMMTLVSERVASGQSDEAIIDELLASYSGAVLLDPPASGATLVLWLAPLAAVGLGAVVIVWWRRHPREEVAAETERTDRKSRLVTPMVLGLSFAVIVVVAGFFLQERSGPATGVADLAGQDLDDVSNETMEAVIAANADDPQIDGMRLALAERYYEEGDYRAAFPHFLEVAGSATATDPQAVTALIRLGWMAWDGNAEAEAAIGLFDQALAIDASSSTALYLKGQVLWCGTEDNESAAALFEQVLADPDLSEEARQRVSADLDRVDSGATCT
ncbi:MAG TPA: cytochrome c-type biogenesis protein CcmH [Acidimicrobiia bacterium]|nr:cytochrome c-type biogenesis protein CcmH [Acidimicrobiia bacterium]